MLKKGYFNPCKDVDKQPFEVDVITSGYVSKTKTLANFLSKIKHTIKGIELELEIPFTTLMEWRSYLRMARLKFESVIRQVAYLSHLNIARVNSRPDLQTSGFCLLIPAHSTYAPELAQNC